MQHRPLRRRNQLLLPADARAVHRAVRVDHQLPPSLVDRPALVRRRRHLLYEVVLRRRPNQHQHLGRPQARRRLLGHLQRCVELLDGGVFRRLERLPGQRGRRGLSGVERHRLHGAGDGQQVLGLVWN